MKHIAGSKCNCCECVWNRIKKNQNITLPLKRGNSSIKHKVDKNDQVVWLPQEKSQKQLWPQKKSRICECLISRLNQFGPSKYPQGAHSYIWALLNHPDIWIE